MEGLAVRRSYVWCLYIQNLRDLKEQKGKEEVEKRIKFLDTVGFHLE